VDEATGFACVPAGNAAVAPEDLCPLQHNGRCDAPEQCPEGTDLFDCNPCGDVTEAGTCDGDVLELCDAAAGLLSTDCTALDAPARCVEQDGEAACVEDAPGDNPADGGPSAGDAGMQTADAGAAGDGGAGAEQEDDSASCSCRVGPGAGRPARALGFGVLASLMLGLCLRRRRPRNFARRNS